MRTGDPCTYGPCGRADTRPYAEGPRCAAHTPAARAGNPEPDSARYCLAICYCGKCGGPRAPLPPIRATVADLDAVRSGRRRASLGEYREAQATPRTRR